MPTMSLVARCGKHLIAYWFAALILFTHVDENPGENEKNRHVHREAAEFADGAAKHCFHFEAAFFDAHQNFGRLKAGSTMPSFEPRHHRLLIGAENERF